jgi:osmoprotectant transport system ATP-binding protein
MIVFEEVSKFHGATAAVDGLSLSIPSGEICALVGPSGSGKSTTLRLINRLLEPDTGRICIEGEDIALLPPVALRRRIGYVIQSIGLFPHWTVARNIATVPTLLGWPAARIAARVEELLNLVGLEAGSFAGRFPHALSGGQQQRVGVARALAADPEVLLMDEPFGALDPISRDDIQQQLLRIQAVTRKTIVLVTHDIDEALRLADRIAVLQQGRLVQMDRPASLLRHPADDFVRSFVGGPLLGLRLLRTQTVQAHIQHGPAPAGPLIANDASLDMALAAMVASGADRVGVQDRNGQPLGVVTLAGLVAP